MAAEAHYHNSCYIDYRPSRNPGTLASDDPQVIYGQAVYDIYGILLNYTQATSFLNQK